MSQASFYEQLTLVEQRMNTDKTFTNQGVEERRFQFHEMEFHFNELHLILCIMTAVKI